MAGNKKKNKPNAYFTYMQMRKPEVEKYLGHSVSYDVVAQYTGPEWQSMSAEKRAKYGPYKTHIPLDSFGVPLSAHREAEELQQKMKQDMLTGIQTIVDLHVTAKALKELEFITVAATEYVTTMEGQIVPAELSLVRATLGDGVDPQQYHAIIRPPTEWPLGYEAEMRAKVQATHKLPTNAKGADCVGTDRRDNVAADMVKFLSQENPGGVDLPPVYTLQEHVAETRTILTQEFRLESVQVWALEELLRQLFAAFNPAQGGVYSTTHARDDLVNSRNSPEYHPALGCKWHRDEMPSEVNWCSLNMAQRWSYLLLNALSLNTSLGVTLVAGRHWPGENPLKGELVHVSQYQDKKNRNRRIASSLQSINTSSRYSLHAGSTATVDADDTDQEEAAGARALPAAASSPAWRAACEPLDTSNSTDFPPLGGGGAKRKTVQQQKKKNKHPQAQQKRPTVTGAFDDGAANDVDKSVKGIRQRIEMVVLNEGKAGGHENEVTAWGQCKDPQQQLLQSSASVGRLCKQALKLCAGSMQQLPAVPTIPGPAAPTLNLSGVGRGRKVPGNK